MLRIIFCLLLISFLGAEARGQSNPYAPLKDYKLVRTLKDSTGKFLGYIYVKENPHYKNSVLSALLVVRANGNKLDTLYRINSGGFYNSRGKAELVNHVKDYHGFKLGKYNAKMTDGFDVENVDSNGRPYDDDNNYFIDWNAKKHVFYYYPMP
jgi:hypothetical protein